MKRTICLIALFLLVQFVSAFLSIFCFNLPNLWREGTLDVNVLFENPSAMGASLILTGVILTMVMWMLNWTDKKGFHVQNYGAGVYALVLVGMVPAIFLVNLFTEICSLQDINEEVFLKLMYNPWGVLALVLVGPFSEELVFRMGIQRHLIRRNISPLGAILLTSILFGIVHGNPAQIPGAMIFGIILGWLYWRSGCIWLSVAAHVFNNLIGVILGWISGQEEILLTDLCGGAWGTTICAVLATVFLYTAFYYLNRMLIR